MESVSRIQVLTPAVVNKIAAGEVIERPASVIKELLENSLDALCNRIDVEVEDGGAELIRIVDDGEGILPDDLPLAVTSHATSKLRQADDLFCVQTMGFRGEALASIAEVSQFRLRSRARGESIGAELAVNCGQRSEIVPCGMAQGTQIEIRQLFCNTPVRRKFLKKAGTEFGYISEQFSRVALAVPRLQMSLTHNGKNVYRLPAGQQLLERLTLFYGSSVTDKLIPIETQHHNVRLWGYVGHPSLHKGTRKSQYLFLNGRYIQDRSLLHALNEAYRGLVMVGRHPVAFLFIEMPGDQVDVNVHPTKSEVRFRDGSLLFRMLLSTLRTKFLQSDLQSTLSIKPAGNPAAPTLQNKQERVERDLVSWAKQQLEHQVAQRVTTPPDAPSPMPAAPSQPMEKSEAGSDDLGADAFLAAMENSGGNEPTTVPFAEQDPVASTASDMQSASMPVPQPSEQRSGIPALQVDDCYIVLSTDQGLTVIDQHALHERVLYERFRNKILEERVEVQKLLVPLTLELSDEQIALLLDQQQMLQQMGFQVEEFGRGMLAVASHPVFLGHQVIEDVIRGFADKLGSSETVTRRDLLDETLHMMACKAAVKAGQKLTPDEIVSLLAQRDIVDDAHHCPHGRPTALVLSREELDRQFGRLGA
ncbi:DNA mismatch repair endonuclease MutL [bacterium]|nr:DNA mismatch repair endonuclease MutL [bacterium]